MKDILIKYGKKEHLQQIVDGTIRFAPSLDYIKIEESMHEKGQGDSLEGKMRMSIERGQIYEKDSHNLIGLLPKINIITQLQDVNTMPIFCLSIYTLNESGILRLDQNHLNCIRSDFKDATHALLILESDVFIDDVTNSIGHKVVFDKIKYYDYSINPMQMFMYIATGEEKIVHSCSLKYEDRYRALLCKDIAFSNQNECRFIVTDELIEQPIFYNLHFNSNYLLIPIDDLYKEIEII